MDDVQPLQVFVRNDKGKIWGPLTPASVELLFDNGIIEGRVQVSLDGANYVFPGRMPNVRIFVPRALWGETVVPGDDLEHPPPPPPVPGTEASGGHAAPGAPPGPPGAPMAGPGALRAGPGAMAGPGARGPRPQQNRPPPPVMAPGGAAPAHAAPPAYAAAPAAPIAPPAPSSPAVATPMSDGSMPPSGDLAKLPVLHLYYLIASSERTGLLTLKLPDRKIDIHFRKGNPEFVDSTHADDALATFLVRAQLANFQQLGRAEAEKAKFGGELMGALFGLGILHPSTAFTHLATRAGNILMRAFAAETGTFAYESKELPPHKAMPLGNRWSVLAEQSRRIPISEIRRRLTSVADNPVMKSGGRVSFDQLRLTPHEARALSYFDGVHSLAQLAAMHAPEADHLFRVAWMLKDLEMVSFAAVKLPPPPTAIETLVEAEVEPLLEGVVDAEPEPPPPPPPPRAPIAPPPQATIAPPPPAAAARPPPPKLSAAPAAGPPRPQGSPGSAPARVPPVMHQQPGAAAGAPARPAAHPPAPPGAVARPSAPAGPAHSGEYDGEIRQLKEVLKTMKAQNHFEVFGLGTKADAGSIKMAYFKLAKAYHPDTVPPGAPEPLAKAKADIFARIGEANRTLVDEKARLEYIAELEAGGTGEQVDVAQILAAEEMFQKGQILVKARKFPEAVKMLDEAIAAHGEEGEFYSYRGFAKFFLTPDRKVGYAEAMKDINICLKRNPRCASVWFHQGMMSKLLGDLSSAKRHFQETVKRDPNHIDAQRELRMMK